MKRSSLRFWVNGTTLQPALALSPRLQVRISKLCHLCSLVASVFNPLAVPDQLVDPKNNNRRGDFGTPKTAAVRQILLHLDARGNRSTSSSYQPSVQPSRLPSGDVREQPSSTTRDSPHQVLILLDWQRICWGSITTYAMRFGLSRIRLVSIACTRAYYRQPGRYPNLRISFPC